MGSSAVQGMLLASMVANSHASLICIVRWAPTLHQISQWVRDGSQLIHADQLWPSVESVGGPVRSGIKSPNTLQRHTQTYEKYVYILFSLS